VPLPSANYNVDLLVSTVLQNSAQDDVNGDHLTSGASCSTKQKIPLDTIRSMWRKHQVHKATADLNETIAEPSVGGTSAEMEPTLAVIAAPAAFDVPGEPEQQKESGTMYCVPFDPPPSDHPASPAVDALVHNVGALSMSYDTKDAQEDMLIDNSSPGSETESIITSTRSQAPMQSTIPTDEDISENEAERIQQPCYTNRHLAVSDRATLTESEAEESFELTYPDTDQDVGLFG
jgi:hypothetical protein